MHFSDRLRKARNVRGFSQTTLATKASFQPSAISHFETGGRKPSFENLCRLADALDVTTDYLLGRAADRLDGVSVDAVHRGYSMLTARDRTVVANLIKVLLKD